MDGHKRSYECNGVKHLFTELIWISNLNLLLYIKYNLIIYNTDFALCQPGWPHHILYTCMHVG
jgi:hypothetical protein